MPFSPFIRKLLLHHSGVTLQQASDCDVLALDIEQQTGEHIGVNTLKRLLGLNNGNHIFIWG